VRFWRPALLQVQRLQRSLRSRPEAEGWVVVAVRNTTAGWNSDADPPPVRDAREALSVVRDRFAGLPIVVVGHSMGARVAIRVADAAGVVGVVGLTPWVPARESVASLERKHVSLAYAGEEGYAECRQAAVEAFAERARSVAASVVVQELPGPHRMQPLRPWRDFALARATASLA